MKKSMAMSIICVLLLLYVPSGVNSETVNTPATENDLAEQFTIICYTLYVVAQFDVDFYHHIPDTELRCKIDFNVEKLDGTLIYDHPFDYEVYTVPPGHGISWSTDIFRFFEEKNIYFGIFKINVDLHILDDDSHQYRTFYGIYLWPHLKIIYLGQWHNLIVL